MFYEIEESILDHSNYSRTFLIILEHSRTFKSILECFRIKLSFMSLFSGMSADGSADALCIIIRYLSERQKYITITNENLMTFELSLTIYLLKTFYKYNRDNFPLALLYPGFWVLVITWGAQSARIWKSA